MKIPKGKTKDEVVNLIMDICSKFKHKYTIDIHEKDDIEQEAFLICLEALERYDGIRPLENFLAFNLKNRLLNFVRKTKTNTLPTVSMPDTLDIEEEDRVRLIVQVDTLMDQNLDPETRQDWLRLKDGVKVSTVRTKQLKNRILQLNRESLKEKDDE